MEYFGKILLKYSLAKIFNRTRNEQVCACCIGVGAIVLLLLPVFMFFANTTVILGAD